MSHTELKDIDAYRRSREISRHAWPVYSSFDWHIKKIIGDQWIEAVDSIGANIAEGHGRFHYLDRNKFNYNARGSLVEVQHWTQLLRERNLITEELSGMLDVQLEELNRSLNMLIKMTKEKAKE